jgi:hypothetical protein
MLKSTTFHTPTELCTFVNKPVNNAITIVSIVYDAGSNMHVLYYR